MLNGNLTDCQQGYIYVLTGKSIKKKKNYKTWLVYFCLFAYIYCWHVLYLNGTELQQEWTSVCPGLFKTACIYTKPSTHAMYSCYFWLYLCIPQWPHKY